MELTRISRKYAYVTLTATLADGSAATVDAVDVSLLPMGDTPTGTTEWIRFPYTDEGAVVLLAGPDADPEGALVVPEDGADLWARVIDDPEVDAAFIDSIAFA